MYEWRKMTEEERSGAMERRKYMLRPWHSPPHRFLERKEQYLITAACYEHAPVVGASLARMDAFSDLLLDLVTQYSDRVYAWCVLPNHYHVLLKTKHCKELLGQLGLLHGRTSHAWNGEDESRGRKVWFGAVEREMRSERHLWASVNYVHHNPVKHGHAARWQEWPWSSARSFLGEVGRERAVEIWREYPVGDYGREWDV